MKRAPISILLLTCFVSTIAAHATLPSVRFGDMARKATCVVLAQPLKSISTDEYEFLALAVASETRCDNSRFVVRRASNESLAAFATTPYLLFLNKLEGNTYSYTAEAFGALPVSNGIVSTTVFMEMPEKTPLETVMALVQRERAKRQP